MRLLTCVIIALCTLSAFGQDKVVTMKKFGESSAKGVSQMAGFNKPLWVTNADSVISVREPAFFLDGKFISKARMEAINQIGIDSIRMDNKEVVAEGKHYTVRAHIFMKPDYTPANISLSALRAKHALPGSPSIFYINENLVKGDYDNFLVDENHILKIEVQKLDDAKENLHVNVIRVLTKTKENLSKAYPIVIRGVGETANNN